MDSKALVKPIVKSTESPEKPEMDHLKQDFILNPLNNEPSIHKWFSSNILKFLKFL